MSKDLSSSKSSIIKSTGIVGIGQVLTILLQILRTKVIAIFLGTTGIGLLGVYHSITDLTRTVSGLGINFSGVKEISKTDDDKIVSKTASVIKRWSIITGILGASILLLFSKQISLFSFGSEEYTYAIMILSGVVLFTSLSQSQIAVIQGKRQLLSMSKASVFGVLSSIIIITPFYYLWGIDAMPITLVLMSVCSYIISSFYYRKLQISKSNPSIKDTFILGKDLVSIGVATSFSSIVSLSTMYIIRAFITRNGSLEDLGLFQASWSVANVYLMTILNSMGADFFPRLSKVNSKIDEINKLVNEQTEVAFLLGGPIIIAMIIFLKIILSLLYTSSFVSAESLLLLLIVGSSFKLISWPLAYIFPVRGNIKYIILTECIWNLLFVLISILLWNKLQLLGIGLAYIIAYVFYTMFIVFLCKKSTQFKFTEVSKKHIYIFIGCIILVSTFIFILPQYRYVTILVLLLFFTYSYYHLKDVLSISNVFKFFRIFK